MVDYDRQVESDENESALIGKGYQGILEFIDQIEEISRLQDKIEITASINQIWQVFFHELQNSIFMEG
jgi:hypothetical protein